MEVEKIIDTPRGRMRQRDYYEIILREAKERMKLGLAPEHWDLIDQKEFEKERKSLSYLDAFL
jgi:hypothetical protein